MKAYTDYPFVELGDVAVGQGPLRECTVLHYDGDKYCTIYIDEGDGLVASIKSGYIYRSLRLQCFSHAFLCKEFPFISDCEVYYQWRVLRQCDGKDKPRLLIPHSDPMEYEFPMDGLHTSQAKAIQYLKDYDCFEEACDEGWILVDVTAYPLFKIRS